MLLAFDKYGKLIRQLTHGAPARQGSEDTFTVRCYFKDINVNRYNIALISLQRPDGTYIEVTEALDFERNYTFYRQPEDDINTAPFAIPLRIQLFLINTERIEQLFCYIMTK